MVICFDVSTDAKRALDDLLGTGQFRNQSEAISMALVNYEIIQRSVSAGDQVVMRSKCKSHLRECPYKNGRPKNRLSR